jgi:mono/diheme cytochrome c family protein
LIDGSPRAAHADGDLYYWIQTGITGGMPSFAGQLSPSQTWDSVNYLRTIENR